MDRPRQAAPYLRDPDAIYRASFAAISEEADLDQLPEAFRPVAIRLIHACGMPDIVDDLVLTEDGVHFGTEALRTGRPVLVDATMVSAGIQRQHLIHGNEIICTLHDERTAELAKAAGTTRSAAAVELWRPHLEGAIVAIGNAPTALVRLLELLDDGGPRPALILGFPVGFVGALESKEALIEASSNDDTGVPIIALRGRRGGSALAAAAVNALARLAR
jgi:precorrin isomerase